ncbi:MAG: FdtA/QdtA family cupin domain-containing protein [Alphaproteobacteria bacterium]|nr:FdtA/QdtA family cupin domain-containing protein [Alphaproteobacteria bacterium]
MSLSDCKILQLRKIEERRGNLTPVEALRDIPFEIKRIYYLYDVPGGSTRAGHAHKALHQFFIAMSGSFDITLKDGAGEQRYHLNRSHYGLYVSPMMWRDLDNFSSGAVCLVLASDYYDENDYFRNYDDYLAALAQQNS